MACGRPRTGFVAAACNRRCAAPRSARDEGRREEESRWRGTIEKRDTTRRDAPRHETRLSAGGEETERERAGRGCWLHRRAMQPNAITRLEIVQTEWMRAHGRYSRATKTRASRRDVVGARPAGVSPRGGKKLLSGETEDASDRDAFPVAMKF